MALFSEKIVSAQFIDNSNTVIEVLYKENDELIPYTLNVDFTQDDFKELIEEISLEEIEKSTKKMRFEESKAINDAINDEINKRLSSSSSKKTALDEMSGSDLFTLINSKNEDSDFIFNMKICVLDDTRVSLSKDKSLKMEIRKAKTLIELLNIYTSLDMD